MKTHKEREYEQTGPHFHQQPGQPFSYTTHFPWEQPIIDWWEKLEEMSQMNWPQTSGEIQNLETLSVFAWNPLQGWQPVESPNVSNMRFFQNVKTGDLVITVFLAGVHKDDLNVKCKDNMIKINARRLLNFPAFSLKADETQEMYEFISEVAQLPFTIDEHKIKTEFKDGLLKLNISQSQEETAKTIKVS